jgi:hypothetical protein
MSTKFSKAEKEKLGLNKTPNPSEVFLSSPKEFLESHQKNNKEKPQNQESTVAKIIAYLFMISIAFLIYWFIFS